MDFRAIDRALERYTNGASVSEQARFALFRGIWQIQQEEAERLAQTRDYLPADDAILERDYFEGTPAFLGVPVAIDSDEFAAVCSRIAGYMSEHAGLEQDVVGVLTSFDWFRFASDSQVQRAGSDPAGYIEECLRGIDSLGVDAACPSNVFMMVPSFALRAFLQNPAAQVMGKLSQVGKNQLYHNKPLRCPACGSPATASYVGGGLELESHARMLYCSTCGTEWPFERIRCGCCGTRNQGHLHWFHVEGDPAHRIHCCDECGGYLRTVFQNDLGAAICMEVEDVAMAYLDQVAQSI